MMFKQMTLALASAVFMSACSSSSVQAEEGPTDMQIAHIAYTAGNIDIRYAHLALAKSKNEKVHEFANLMLQDHKAVNDQALALLGKLGATPEDNPTSQQLLKGADEKVAELSALDGIAFDRAYAANELGYHEFVNKTVEEAFIPAADNAEFKALLGDALAVFKIHEGHAGMMVKELN